MSGIWLVKWRRAHLNGVETQMDMFHFTCAVFLGELILRLADNLRKALQHKLISAVEGQHLAWLILEVLWSLRDSDRYTAIYGKAEQEQSRFGISDPALPRKCCTPQQLEVGSSTAWSWLLNSLKLAPQQLEVGSSTAWNWLLNSLKLAPQQLEIGSSTAWSWLLNSFKLAPQQLEVGSSTAWSQLLNSLKLALQQLEVSSSKTWSQLLKGLKLTSQLVTSNIRKPLQTRFFSRSYCMLLKLFRTSLTNLAMPFTRN